jgi:hypothetical protein
MATKFGWSNICLDSVVHFRLTVCNLELQSCSYLELAILCNKTGCHQKLTFPFKSTNSNFNTYVASFVSL